MKQLRSWLLPAYALLLVASHVVSARYLASAGAARPGVEVVGEVIGEAGAPALLLLPGIPGRQSDLDLAAQTWSEFRLVRVDLPGSASAPRGLDDLSLSRQAARLQSWLVEQELDSVHVVGEGLGAALALQLTAQSTNLVESLTLMDGIGVEEKYLLGDHLLNNMLNLAQGSLSWLVHHGVPHFGLIHRLPWHPDVAKSYAQLDLRPLRASLLNFDGPVQLLHNPRGRVVPASVADEHQRIAPQALRISTGGVAAREDPEALSDALSFWRTIESGEGAVLRRADVTPGLLAAASEPYVRQRLVGTAMLGMMLLLIVSMQSSEDLTCIGAGLLVWKGVIGYFPATLGCFIGLLIGDSGLYLIGRYFGGPALRLPPFSWFIDDARVQAQARRFKDNMFGIIFTSRFLPGSRVPVYVGAGMLQTGLLRFLGCLSVAAIVWAPILVGLSAWLGDTFLSWFEDNMHAALFAVVGVIIALYLLLHKGLPLLTWKGRRLALGAWRRFARWEFWPRWKFYPPIAVYILWQMIRHRSVTVMMLANPGMPYGGLVLERKSEIFEGLAGSPGLLPWILLPQTNSLEARMAALAAFRAAEGIDGDIVLKPDIGYRGSGVTMVRDEAGARDCLAAAEVDMIAQPRIRGPEFGVFYMRQPGETTGKVTSITAKDIPQLHGDGEQTIERLILSDDRAVCMAPFFLKRFAERLDEVPAAGTHIPLTDLGTHSMGSLFLDAGHLHSPELEAAVDALIAPYDEVYFGRFDLRVADEAALTRGEGLRIMELNGLTAESTHIYDPRHSLAYGWRTIMAQWRRAFEIASANRERGHEPMTLLPFFALLRIFWKD